MALFQTSIAVLPFEIRSSSAGEWEYLGEGIAEEIIHALSRIPQLKVSSRRSSFKKGLQDLGAHEIAEHLKVENLLEGSVDILGNRIKIRASLIELKEDQSFWTQSWQRSLDALFEVQDEISIEIADQLREHFGHLEIEEHLVKANTTNLEAFKLYLRAKYYFNRWNPKDVHYSIELYGKAFELDPNYNDALIGLADSHSFLATAGFADPVESWASAKSYMDQVFNIDPDHVGLNYLLANYHFFVKASYKESYYFAQKTINLRPHYPEGQQFMAFMEILRGDFSKAKTHIHYALAVDPLNPESQFYQAYYYHRSQDFEKAILKCEALLNENPQSLPALIVRFYALIASGKADVVIEEIKDVPEAAMMPDERLGIELLSAVAQRQAIEERISVYRKMADTNQSPQTDAYLYLIYAHLKRNDEAFEILEKLFSHKSAILLLNFMDPLASSIWLDPRFPKMKDQIYALGQNGNKPKPKRRSTASLSKLEQASIQGKLEKLIQVEQVFLRPDINLRTLSNELQIHPNQLSWYLNDSIGKNFNDFINQHRLAYFIDLAKDPSNQHISLIGLAYESGFNSKSVFNTSFKKSYGTTPSQYLKSQA